MAALAASAYPVAQGSPCVTVRYSWVCVRGCPLFGTVIVSTILPKKPLEKESPTTCAGLVLVSLNGLWSWLQALFVLLNPEIYSRVILEHSGVSSRCLSASILADSEKHCSIA